MYDVLGYPNDDYAARYSNTSAGVLEWWHTLATNEFAFPAACAVIIALLIVIAERKKQAIAHKLSFYTGWCMGFVRSAWTIAATRLRGKAMLKKKQEEFDRKVQNVLIHMIDTAVDKKAITETIANNTLKRLARGYPDMIHALWKPENVKAAIVERRKNEDKDANGKIIPLPIP